MDVQRVAVAVPVENLASAVEQWQLLLGVEPTFVDGDRWAQFDLGGARIALAGTDRVSDEPCLMLKVSALDDAREEALADGADVGAVEDGAHERRSLITDFAAMPIVVYEAK
jgi:hypothetical protein